MAIRIKCTCDGCETVIIDRETTPTELVDGLDMGSECVTTTQQDREMVFHSEDCCYKWLKSQGRHGEAEEFKNTPWMA